MISPLRAVKEFWNQHWFQEKGPEHLAIQRILFFGFLSVHTLVFERPYYWSWSTLPQDLWMPVGPFVFFDTPPLSADFIWLLEFLWPGMIVLCALGLFTRLMTFLAFISHFIFIGTSLSYGEGSHDQLITVVFLFIFSLSRCSDRYSLDSLFTNYKEKKADSDYFWPVQLQRWIFCSYFVGAGVSKIQVGGLAWIYNDSLAHHMIFSHYRTSMSAWAIELGIGLSIASIPLLSNILAALTILLEIFCPFALFTGQTKRQVFMLIHLLMVVAFYFVATKGFMNMVGLYFCWFSESFERLLAQSVSSPKGKTSQISSGEEG